MIYYDHNSIIVRNSKKSDVEYLKTRLRESDVREVWASNNHSPEEALQLSLDKSIFCLTVHNGHPLAIFGITTENILGKKATIFMLSSPELDMIRIRFARNSRFFINMLLEFYPFLENYVHKDNPQSIRWLKMCGASVNNPAPYGIEKENFHYFSFRKA